MVTFTPFDKYILFHSTKQHSNFSIISSQIDLALNEASRGRPRYFIVKVIPSTLMTSCHPLDLLCIQWSSIIFITFLLSFLFLWCCLPNLVIFWMESKVAKFEVFGHPKLFIFSPCISSRNFKLGLFGLYQIWVNLLISYGWDFTIVSDVFHHEYVMIKTHPSTPLCFTLLPIIMVGYIYAIKYWILLFNVLFGWLNAKSSIKRTLIAKFNKTVIRTSEMDKTVNVLLKKWNSLKTSWCV